MNTVQGLAGGNAPTTPTPFKYEEARLIKEIFEYVSKTYKGHYNQGEDNIQSMDLIMAGGHGEGFCVGNILKYAQRYGKKKGFNRDDIMKVIHYSLFLLYIHDRRKAEAE